MMRALRFSLLPSLLSSLLSAAVTWSVHAHAGPLQSALLPSGVQADHILDLWRFTLAICTVVFAAVLAALLAAIRRAPRSRADTPVDLSSLSQPERRVHPWIGSAVGASIVLLLILLTADVHTDRKLSGLGLNDALHIELIGHQWWWEARYGDAQVSQQFTTANELHIPVGRPVILTLKSQDVIHSFWVPSLHGKRDLIPGRTATIRIRADNPGDYRGQCAEFCGLQHAMMAMHITAQPDGEYRAWASAQRQPAPAPADDRQLRGQQVFLTGTCALCHTVQGTAANGRVGPDLTHIASRQTLAAGLLPNTPANLASWIVDPASHKPGVNMPANPLSQDDLQALLGYLGTLK